jgi:hypothetical protein
VEARKRELSRSNTPVRASRKKTVKKPKNSYLGGVEVGQS